jgi:CheY-like chemotaxis protein
LLLGPALQFGGCSLLEGAAGFVYLTKQQVQAGQQRLQSVLTAGLQPLAGRGELVVLVDDDDGVRQFAAAALRERGYEVLAFADGEAALRRFDELLADEPQALGRAVAGAPAILVTDVVMPGIDGKELAARVRQLRPALRVLYISGYSDDILTRDGQFDDDIALLEKPFSGDDLAVAVRAVLDSASSR